jgi:hypothetical protein
MKKKQQEEQEQRKTSLAFPVDVWEQAKIQAVMERLSLAKFITKALREYLARNGGAR